MAGRRVPLVSFNPDDAVDMNTLHSVAVQNSDADDLLNDILAMQEDERYARYAAVLEAIYNWVSERGRCTQDQRGLIDTFIDRVEHRR